MTEPSSPLPSEPPLAEPEARPPLPDDGLGARLAKLIQSAHALAAVFRQTLHFTLRGAPQPGAVSKQLYEIGNRSTVFLCVVMGFIGMIFVYQAGLQMRRVLPDLTQLGPSYLELLIKELAPTICAMMLATRVGAGIAAEVGSMVVTEQIDALRMCAADPVDYLIRPRFSASIVMTVALVVIATAVAVLSGVWTADTFFGVSPQTFLNLSLLDAGDVVVGLTKCVAYGGTIPIVSGYCGLSTYGGSEGVGWATTRAVVNSSLAVIVLDFVISVVGYLVFG